MRTNIVLDDELVSKALQLGGYRTKKSAIEAGLRLLIQTKAQAQIKKLKGTVKWQGDLEEMRRD